jgi:hypothetical protein
MIFTPGHAWRSRCTSNFKIAQLCRVAPDVARAQITHQQLFAAKNVERQKAPVAVVAVKGAALLVAVHPVVGRVEIKDQLRRRFAKRRDELLHQHPVKSESCLPVHPVFQPAERGTRRQFLVASQRRLPGQIAPQRGVIVEVLVPQGQTKDALAQEIDLPMHDEKRVTRIGQHRVERGDETEATVGLPQQENAPVAAHVASGETRLDLAAVKAGKLEQLLRTICHRRRASFLLLSLVLSNSTGSDYRARRRCFFNPGVKYPG